MKERNNYVSQGTKKYKTKRSLIKKPLCICKNFRLKKIYIIVTTKSTWIIRLFAAGQLEALKLALKTPIRSSIFACPFAAGEVSKEGVFSSLYFPAFKLNTKICGVNLCIQYEYRKIQIRNHSVFGHLSRSAECIIVSRTLKIL